MGAVGRLAGRKGAGLGRHITEGADGADADGEVLPRLAEFADATSIDGPRLFSIFTMCAVLSRCTENVSVAAALRRYVEWNIFCTDHGLATVTFEPALLFSCTFELVFRH